MGLSFILLAGAGIVFVVAQMRFVDAYLEWQGGPARSERSRMLFRGYDGAMFRRAPFGIRAMFQPVNNDLVEGRRRQLLLACGMALVAVVTTIALFAFGVGR